MKKPPKGGRSRHGQLAQAATAARSKRTIEFAFTQIHLRRRIPLIPQGGICGN